MPLRDYQLRAIAELRKHYRNRPLLCLPTGAGKTSVAAEIIRSAVERGNRCIFLVHRRELVDQAVERLAQFGVRAGRILAGERERLDRPVQVASIPTLLRRAHWPAELVIVDECFPQGTMVDGRAIESLRIGDAVHGRRVTHTFKSRPAAMVRVHTEAGAIYCTPEHPFLTPDGWVAARSLDGDCMVWHYGGHEVLDLWTDDGSNASSEDDGRSVRQKRSGVVLQGVPPGGANRCGAEAPSEDSDDDVRRLRSSGGRKQSPESLGFGGGASRPGVLLIGVQGSVDERSLSRNAGEHSEQVRVGVSSAVAQGPHAQRSRTVSHQFSTESDWSRAQDAGRQRSPASYSAGTPCGCAGASDGSGFSDAEAATCGDAELLQDRHGRHWIEVGDRSGRRLARVSDRARTRPAQGCPPGWVRVDRVEVLEPTSDGTFGGVCPDGHVYNLEVEGHEYVANGFHVHNCAHAVSESWSKCLARYEGSWILGLTATPVRLDGRGLGDLFGVIVEPVTTRELIDQGYLVEPTVFAPPIDLRGVRIKRGDYDLPQLAERMSKLVGSLTKTWLEHARGWSTVVFAVNVEHSMRIVDAFQALGVRAAHVDYKMAHRKRAATLRRLRTGELTMISQVQLLSEGWDLPTLQCAVLARPTKSLALYRQMVGRVMRPPGPVVVLDHAGNTNEHGLATDDIEWTLDGAHRKSDPQAAPVRTCLECYAVMPAAAVVCPECGAAVPERAVDQPEIDNPGELVLVTGTRRAATMQEKQRMYRTVLHLAVERGYRLGWARMQYRDAYGTWPRLRELERAEYKCAGNEWEAKVYGGRTVTRCARCFAEAGVGATL